MPGTPSGPPIPRRLLLAGVPAALLAGCTTAAPAPAPAAPARPPDPPEITAGSADRLPPGRPGAGTPSITLGTKDFPEQFLLGLLYQQALSRKGYSVIPEQNIGASEVIDTAFTSTQIQMYLEYLGEVPREPETAVATSADLYRSVQRFEADDQRHRATVLKQTPYQNVDVLVVKPELAQRYELRSVDDLSRLPSGFRIAGQPSFRFRTSGLVGLAQVYGLTGVRYLAVPPSVVYEALDAGQADVADAFSTDPQIDAYVRLADPRNVFGFQHLAPIVRTENLDGLGQGFRRTCDWVSSLLTEEVVRQMNRRVQADGVSEYQVARDFLDAAFARAG